MSARICFALVGIVLVCGCGPLVWNKPGLTDSQLAQDKYQCMQETGYTGIRRERQEEVFKACMESRGYKLDR